MDPPVDGLPLPLREDLVLLLLLMLLLTLRLLCKIEPGTLESVADPDPLPFFFLLGGLTGTPEASEKRLALESPS